MSFYKVFGLRVYRFGIFLYISVDWEMGIWFILEYWDLRKGFLGFFRKDVFLCLWEFI